MKMAMIAALWLVAGCGGDDTVTPVNAGGATAQASDDAGATSGAAASATAGAPANATLGAPSVSTEQPNGVSSQVDPNHRTRRPREVIDAVTETPPLR